MLFIIYNNNSNLGWVNNLIKQNFINYFNLVCLTNKEKLFIKNNLKNLKKKTKTKKKYTSSSFA